MIPALTTLIICCLFSGSIFAENVYQASSGGAFSLSYANSSVTIDTLYTETAVYQRFTLPGYISISQSGMPDLPLKTVFFAAPDGITPNLNFTYDSKHYEGISIIPVAELEGDNPGFSREVFRENPEHYSLSGFHPKEHVTVGDPVKRDGITVWKLQISAVLCDAFNKKAVLAENIDIAVSFGGGNSAWAVPNGARLPDYIINKDAFVSRNAARPSRVDNDPFKNGDWYRIEITDTGMYSITGNELSKSGFPLSSVPIDEIRMYYGGGWLVQDENYSLDEAAFREIAIKIDDVSGNGILNTSDEIIFYGEALSRFYSSTVNEATFYQNHLYDDNNVYWLTRSSEGRAKRMGSSGESPSANIEAQTSYRSRTHLENELLLELKNGGAEWYWQAIMTNNVEIPFSAPDFVPGTESFLEIGIVSQYKKNVTNHEIFAYIKGDTPVLYKFSGNKSRWKHSSTVDLKESGNRLVLARKLDVGYRENSAHLDWINIEYSRQLKYTGKSFDLFHVGTDSPEKFTLSGVSSSNVAVFDVSDPYSPSEFSSSVYDSNAKTLSYQNTFTSDTPSHIQISNMSSLKNTHSISKKNKVGLRDIRANHIIITHPDFQQAAQKLANYRNTDSSIDKLTSVVVIPDNIFDEFNWGIYDPLAIRYFLRHVWENGDQSLNNYCCILGDATYKYKNLTDRQAEIHRVPSYSLFDPDISQALSNDDFFCWFDRNRTPAFAMGRICASDETSAAALVDKIINYEQNPEPGPWHNRVLLVADDAFNEGKESGGETAHTRYTEALDDPESIPASLERKKLMMLEYPMKNDIKPGATDDFIKYINEGYLVMNFTGHGNDDLLAHEHILIGTRDMAKFANARRQSLFLAFSCTVGNYTQLENLSLAEMLLNKTDGGMISVIAASNETFGQPNFSLNYEFMQCLFFDENNVEHRIGRSLALAKTNLSGSTNSRYYLNFGDPATRLMMPRNTFTIAQSDTVYRLERLDLSGAISNGEGPVSYDGKVTIKARSPKTNKSYIVVEGSHTTEVEYTQPGKIFFLGEYDVSGNSFNASFVVPKDTPAKGGEGSIYLFATGQKNEASAVLNGFTIGGLDPDAPEDGIGPEIDFSFDSKNFDDGDYISRQPSLKASFNDPSGVNVVGNRGHNITLLIDQQEIVVLTDKYKAFNSYSSGELEYSLPILTPGEHEFEMSVFDTYNNVAKKTVKAFVVGSESGDIAISDLLNYPNPMANDGTAFTFRLTDDAREATIKIYSQAGRLVDKLSFPASYGFNKVDWKPPFNIANGVYFYKLSIKSLNGRKSSKIEKLVMMK